VGVAATTPAVSERTTTLRAASVRPRITTCASRMDSGVSLAWTLGRAFAAGGLASASPPRPPNSERIPK